MIANARMYSVSPETAGFWRLLLSALIETAGLDIELLEHNEPTPIDELWGRTDKAAVFMCGLPYSRSKPRPRLIAAPVPVAEEFRGLPHYWSELVVRKDSAFNSIEDTFGGRIAFTVPESQSGCIAALSYFMTRSEKLPLYDEIIAPQVTPLGAVSAVIDGLAEIAPIDAYALRLLQKYRRDLTSRLRVVARTARTPIPPLVASRTGFDALEAAFLGADKNPALQTLLADLLLARFVQPAPDSYDVLHRNYDLALQYWHARPLASIVHPVFAECFAKAR